jgi:glycosidase
VSFADDQLAGDRPDRIDNVPLPHRTAGYPSPASWHGEVLYFLLVDRFSDGAEATRPLLDPTSPAAFRPAGWRWDAWYASGSERFQGGDLAGVTSKLAYLQDLGVTTVWLSPIFQQRGHLDTYHGYGIADFLDVDPRFGSRADLVALVTAAHQRHMRIVLDVVFNHSGDNWLYPPGTPGGQYTPTYIQGRYNFGAWRGDQGQEVPAIAARADGVWPVELQDPDDYTRAGSGNLGAGALEDPNAEFRRTDFIDLRDFNLDAPRLLDRLAACYKYWIALTDCDGLRIDTLKHVTEEQGRNFCGTIKEFAANNSKANFLLIGEVAGGDEAEDRYLTVLGQNLNATLDIGSMRPLLGATGKGLAAPADFFAAFTPAIHFMGSHRMLGDRHVSILDDHDEISGEKLRYSANAVNNQQVVAGTALQLLCLGIPCLYYGSEQAFAGPEPSERRWLPNWGGSDTYLREAMFGPAHPRAAGTAGLPVPGGTAGPADAALPGFGPFGTAGAHCFDPVSPTYRRIQMLAQLRQNRPVLQSGRQYVRPASATGVPTTLPPAGQLIAWSRILDDEEALCIINGDGTASHGGAVLVDANLSPAGSTLSVLASTATVDVPGLSPMLTIGAVLPVRGAADGTAYVELDQLPPSEVLVLTNLGFSRGC